MEKAKFPGFSPAPLDAGIPSAEERGERRRGLPVAGKTRSGARGRDGGGEACPCPGTSEACGGGLEVDLEVGHEDVDALAGAGAGAEQLEAAARTGALDHRGLRAGDPREFFRDRGGKRKHRPRADDAQPITGLRGRRRGEKNVAAKPAAAAATSDFLNTFFAPGVLRTDRTYARASDGVGCREPGDFGNAS